MSNHLKRIITAIVSIPIIILLSFIGNVYFFLFISIVSAISLVEFYKLAELKGANPNYYIGVVVSFFINLSFFHHAFQNFVVDFLKNYGILISFPTHAQCLVIIFLLSVITMLVVELFRNRGSVFLNLSSTILGLVYVSLCFGTLIGLREIFNSFDFPILRYYASEISSGVQIESKVYSLGGYTVIAIFVIIWICDSAAYYGGRLLGRHKLYPRISPNKTWEGAICGFVFAIVTAVLAKYLVLEYLTLFDSLVIGLIVGIFGQVGDLVESMFKREVGVKDSSNLIPGHGGLLDRFDSLLFVSPLVYIYVDFILFS